MDSYVVRIYRRDTEAPGKVAGPVEEVERRECGFKSIGELWAILTDHSRSHRGKIRNASEHDKKN